MAEPSNLGRASLLSTPSPKRTSFAVGDHRPCSAVLNNQFFKQGLGVALAVALFGGPLFALADIPDDPGLVILDVSMVLASLMFCIELVVNWMAIPSYRCSFFFLMDVLGTLSMVFEISFLLGGGAVRAVLLRSARAAKLGARAGRIFKLVMCYSLLIKGPEGADGKPRFEAKVLAQRLTTSIATRVAMLTIFLVAFVPLLDLPIFPRQDRSLELWARNLEEVFAAENTTKLSAEMNSMVLFYENSDYAPYAVDGWGLSLTTSVSEPVRRQNRIIIEVDDCLTERTACQGSERATIYFNFTGANQMGALMEIGLVLVIVGIMIAMTHDLGSILTMTMVRPLEKMFGMLLQQAQQLIDIVASEEDEDEDEDEEARASELETIERTLAKLSRIAGQALNKNVISKEEMAKKSEYEKAVLVDILRTEVRGETLAPMLERKSLGAEHIEMEKRLQSWEFDTLSLDDSGQESMVMHIFFHSDFGVASGFCDAATFKAFYDAVKPNYKDVPYHCFAHACDVLHTVFRLSSLSMGSYWMREVDQYSLLIAALCHDMGHFGKTNPFLVESKHELAITYNDKSPLENMHCAKLFEICKEPSTDAFGKATKEVYKEARKVAVATILHTDNANHFAMIKDISQVYEAHEATCEKQAGSSGMLTEYRDKILEPNRLLWLELFLHLADVSNPLKPFDLSKAWAMRVLDEFFQQGDEEKQQGLPVGMLNDRDKVNKPGSQHGFITFLVSPLVVQSVNLFPDFMDLHVEMVANMEKWRDEWVADVKPSDEELAPKNADITKCRATSDRLLARRKPQKATPTASRGWSWSNGMDTE